MYVINFLFCDCYIEAGIHPFRESDFLAVAVCLVPNTLKYPYEALLIHEPFVSGYVCSIKKFDHGVRKSHICLRGNDKGECYPALWMRCSVSHLDTEHVRDLLL